MKYLYVAGTIIFTVYGQLVLKWQVERARPLPEPLGDKVLFLLKLLLNPWVISSVLGAFLAMLCWMAAMTQLPLSYAYPFMSLSFVLVLVLSSLMLGEPLNTYKVLGVALIMVGVLVVSLGYD